MLEGKFARGFTEERLKSCSEPKVHHDSSGYFIYTFSENVKVYFDDYYAFLENVYEASSRELAEVESSLEQTSSEYAETIAFYTARAIILKIVSKTAYNFYMDGTNFGVIMTPWCFGTVILEKVEVYRGRLSRGEVSSENIPEYPYYVIRYIEEIYKKTLLDLFDFPTEAFKMRWQYSELLKKYSKVLSNITTSLNSVLLQIKNYGT